MESVKQLIKQLKQLKKMGLEDITVKIGDSYKSTPETSHPLKTIIYEDKLGKHTMIFYGGKSE